MDSYDFVVIGSGPGGYVAAIRAAQLNYKVAIVEKEESLGGVCLNWGCIPTKSLLTSAEVYKKVKEAESYGVRVNGKVEVDVAAIVERSRGIVEKLRSGVSMLMKKNKIEVLKGTATLLGGGSIRIEHAGKNTTKKARHIILATGSSPRITPNLSADFIWTAKDAMMFKNLPESVLIIGSGAIGMEFASFYNTIGSKVTIVEAQKHILPLEDLDISNTMEKILCKRGVSILKGSQVQEITKSGSVLSAKIVDSAGKETVQKFSNALSAIGVVPNTKDLGLENTKVKLCEKGFVVIDSFCKTEEAGLYAIGDVAGSPCLAHKASHEAVICVENIAKSE
ncbi:FAD-dependent oxidoreductase, partial [Anaplasma bovis]|uniref:FAD-dependent oxidoreductase n=1 Tax=Anaplasma bovis TaxID=186733 RepID=UPI002FEF3F9C